MTASKSLLNVSALMSWPFASEQKAYTAEDASRYAVGFGAGLPGEMCEADQIFLQPDNQACLPMIAVPLADGEFWHADPRTGIVWQKMVHAGESITVHRPLPLEGSLRLTQKVDKLLDRGQERGGRTVAGARAELLFAGDAHRRGEIPHVPRLRSGVASRDLHRRLVAAGPGLRGGRAEQRDPDE